MTKSIEHGSYNDIYSNIKIAGDSYTANFSSIEEAKLFRSAARSYSQNNKLGWKLSIKENKVTVVKTIIVRMTVGLLISKLEKWDKKALVDAAIMDEDGDRSWFTIVEVEELYEKSVKEHVLIYIGECVMF